MSNKSNAVVAGQRKKLKKNIFYRIFKRATDIVCSIIALIVLSPLLIGISLAIVIEDGGPVVFKQKRVGKNKEVFYMYKFRSMKKDAEKIVHEIKEKHGKTDIGQKLKDSEDPRITKVGRFIRKTNIDELPQIINILAGQMSLVGPRPYVTYEVEAADERYGDIYDERYDVPPGLTCYWQATFKERCCINFENRLKMDVKYAKEANYWIDIKLIFKTAVYSIIGKAGY